MMMMDARARWEMLNLIRREKFDIILPQAMRENQIDMWITMVKLWPQDPLAVDLGSGIPCDKWGVSEFFGKGRFVGYYVFTDRGGDRIERAALGLHELQGYTLRHCGAYDIFGAAEDIGEFVAERDPKRIGINMSEKIGVADGLSHTCYQFLVNALGEKYAQRLVSAERVVADFRSRRVASEIVAFGKAAELSRQLMERALSNEVITPGVTTRDDVGWWVQDQLLALGLSPLCFQPALPTIRYPKEITSKDYIIQRGDLLNLDWGVNMLNFRCDFERIAYVLREGETAPPATIQEGFNQGLEVRKLIRKHVKPGRTGAETLELLYRKVEEAGFIRQEVELKIAEPDIPKTEINIGWHSVGNVAHGAGPAIWTEKPLRVQFEIRPNQLFAFEFFVFVPLPEWGGKKLRIDFEEDVIVTENGVQWLYPAVEKILLIR